MLASIPQSSKQSVYLLKRSKQPDHLFILLEKTKKKENAVTNEPDEETKNKIKQQIIKKRVENIVKNSSSKGRVSEGVPFVKKKWVSPLSQLHQNQAFDPFSEVKVKKIRMSQAQKDEINKVINVLDLNKKLKYFGQFLKVQYQNRTKTILSHSNQKDIKLKYLNKKYDELTKNLKPKMCIMNYTLQQKLTFINYLQNDDYYKQIIRKTDQDLTRMLIQSLKINQNFSLTSFINFYDIFVWQMAPKKIQMQFVAKLLMQDSRQRLIVQISRTIDLICSKINVDYFNKALNNFSEVVKKLIFGDDYQHAQRKEYFITRKALLQSLDVNQECISIFINIFYAS